MQFLKTILDFVFPPRCEVCSSLGPEVFCGTCRSKVNFLKPSAFVHSVGVYEGPLKEAIMKLKYKKRLSLSKPLAEIMTRYINSHFDIKPIDYFIPVPLHPKRQRDRGFNQSDILSQELSHIYNIPTVSGLLQRTRETHVQFDLPRMERFKNVKGAFAVSKPELVHNKKVLLLDDIYTTGSTVSECTKVLKESGAERVHVLTLSRAVE